MRQEAAAQQPNGLSTEHDEAAEGSGPGADAADGGADEAADLADLASPGAVAMTPAPHLAQPHLALAGPSTSENPCHVIDHSPFCRVRCTVQRIPELWQVRSIRVRGRARLAHSASHGTVTSIR